MYRFWIESLLIVSIPFLSQARRRLLQRKLPDQPNEFDCADGEGEMRARVRRFLCSIYSKLARKGNVSPCQWDGAARTTKEGIFAGEWWRGTTKPNGWLPFLFFIPFKESPRESWRANRLLRVLSLFLYFYGISFSFIFSHFQVSLFLFYVLDL